MKFTDEEVLDKISALNGWQLIDGQIEKTYRLKDFASAMKVVNQIAMIAENANHHPDIIISYNKVTFKLSTHSESGITQKDFALAKQIEQTAALA